VLVGDVKTLVERRGEALKAFAAFGIKPEQIFAALEVEGLDDIGLDHMSSLVGMHSALKSGEATVEEMFPATRAKDKPGDLTSRLDRLADDGISSGPPAASTAADEGGGEGLQQASAAADPSPASSGLSTGVGGDESTHPPVSPSSPPLPLEPPPSKNAYRRMKDG
jgi:hypothetical protein